MIDVLECEDDGILYVEEPTAELDVLLCDDDGIPYVFARPSDDLHD